MGMVNQPIPCIHLRLLVTHKLLVCTIRALLPTRLPRWERFWNEPVENVLNSIANGQENSKESKLKKVQKAKAETKAKIEKLQKEHEKQLREQQAKHIEEASKLQKENQAEFLKLKFQHDVEMLPLLQKENELEQLLKLKSGQTSNPTGGALAVWPGILSEKAW